MTERETFIERFGHDLLSVDRMSARSVLMEACKVFGRENVPDIIISPVLESIGKQWESGEVALSQVYMSGIICEELIDDIWPHREENISSPIAIATFEDYHALGKRIVLSILKSRGMDVRDYGQGVQAADLLQRVKKDKIRILLLSTLMLPSALHIRKLRDHLDKEGLDVRIVVGGAPFRFDEKLWKQVGADAMGRTASDALEITRKMMEEIS